MTATAAIVATEDPPTAAEAMEVGVMEVGVMEVGVMEVGVMEVGADVAGVAVEAEDVAGNSR